MSRTRRSLDDDILAAFERACREQDFLVADFLLQALEAMARRDGNNEPVHSAYRELAGALSQHRSA
jgi:hypothetical protein